MSDLRKAHIPPTPFHVRVIRTVQLVLALGVLGLISYAIDGCDSSNVELQNQCPFSPKDLHIANFNIFCTAWTIIIFIYLMVTKMWYPRVYNMWAQLFLEFTGCLFWLVGFGALGRVVRRYSKDVKVVMDNVDLLNSQLQMCSPKSTYSCANIKEERDFENKIINKWITATVASGVGALIWFLFIFTLIVFIRRLRRHLRDPANKDLSSFGFSAEPRDAEAAEQGEAEVQVEPFEPPVQPPMSSVTPPQQAQYPPQ